MIFWLILLYEGCGSVYLTNGFGSVRPKNIWILQIQIRIRNTDNSDFSFLLQRLQLAETIPGSPLPDLQRSQLHTARRTMSCPVPGSHSSGQLRDITVSVFRSRKYFFRLRLRTFLRPLDFFFLSQKVLLDTLKISFFDYWCNHDFFYHSVGS